jgi:small subunit ribosomal protein S2|uniref:Small ribosomal subunit protein uS2c n=2 Tax=unclassified Ostreobium TaxID=2086555 RepID=A0A1X9RPM5_9CHLO|nr:ribosomal protein S2 [Ostreobium sp. HV05007a]ARQ82252.1 ribosomal protein S2 [Ostreobium sp. HV05042]
MSISIKTLINKGLHFGHQKRAWNPKMTPYIYTEQNNIHIIDLIQTYSHLRQTLKFLADSTAQGKTLLFVGTKKQASKLVAETAKKCNSFFVNERWLGGLLTNWFTIRKSISKLKEIEIQEKNNLFLNLSKKEIIKIKKEKERLEKYLGGVKKMLHLPDIVIIIDQQREINAVLECQKLGIRSITILDTNGDPSLADLFIPANDDSITSLNFILNEFLKYIQYGQKKFNNYKKYLT